MRAARLIDVPRILREGRYSSARDVVHAGLRRLSRFDDWRISKSTQYRAGITAGARSGTLPRTADPPRRGTDYK